MNYDLTPNGVSQMISDLYALPPSQLREKAAAVRNNFKRFVIDNFLMSNDQKTYLNGLSDLTAQTFGDECSTCFVNKLKVSLVYPDPPAAAYSKYVESSSNVRVRSGLAGEPEATGELIFEIIYLKA